MALEVLARIPLPDHRATGGFDHAAIDARTDRLFVAHTANAAVEVIDLAHRRHERTIPGLRGVAGVWVDTSQRLLFTSNRGDDTASVFRIEPDGEQELLRVPTGVRPNGMAFDPVRRLWMIAGVGNASLPHSPPTLTFVDLHDPSVSTRVEAPGRTRWATYHLPTDSFYVNIADPAVIVSVRSTDPSRIDRTFPIPARGPHGMEQDSRGQLLYCACDDGALVTLKVPTGEAKEVGRLSGTPDVLWADAGLDHLYAATDEAATVEVFGTDSQSHLQTFPTSPGAHTLTVDATRHEVHVFLPKTHEDLVLADR